MSLRHVPTDVSAARELAFGPSFAQNKPSSSIYVFGSDDSTAVARDANPNARETIQMTEFKARAAVASRNHEEANPGAGVGVTLIEHELSRDDTLPGLALRFACTVGQIKAANQLMADQDFKLLQKVKIPVRKHGILEEQYKKDAAYAKSAIAAEEGKVEEEEEGGSGSDTDVDMDQERPVIKTISIRSHMRATPSLSSTGKQTLSFLQKMDQDLKQIRKFEQKSIVGDNWDDDDDDDDARLSRVLRAPLIRPLRVDHRNESDHMNEAGICGINWKILIGVLVLIFIIGPTLIAVGFIDPFERENPTSG